MAAKDPLQEQRLANLRQIIDEMGRSPSALAHAMGLSSNSFVSQMLGRHRRISDNYARKIESAAGKPRYWLDQDHTSRNRMVVVDPSMVGASAQAVAQAQQELKAQITPEKYAEIVNLVYERAQEIGAADADYALRLVKLTM